MKFNILPFAALTCLPLSAGTSKSPIDSGRNSGDWQWSISMAAGIRKVGELKINSSYRSKSLIPPSFVGGNSLTVPPVGDLGSNSDREYNDGYVRQDASTGFDGLTQYWGYQNSGQVQGDQLAYQATGYQSIYNQSFNIPRHGPASRDTLQAVSPHIQADLATPWKIGGLRVGWSVGFDFASVDQGIGFSNWSGRQTRDDYRLDYEDRYDLGGVIPPLPPYAGSDQGAGALIPNRPGSRSITPVLLFTDVATFSNRVFANIDVDVYSFTFGPSLTQSWGGIDLSVQAGIICNVYNWQGQQAERLSVTTRRGTSTYAAWVDENSGVKFRPGVYAQGDITYDVGERFRIGAYFRLDTASEFRGQAGPTIFKLDPSGFNSGFQIRYTMP
ncbi:hypothetical protein [Haloferula rosea]|uniref:Uncharacterized protein n=1 Tax=Haloferula rosea TaxID=490093 RepID=A0A934R9R4_9BACT|nr:hypothetical protein [Haloferula rosea]MBK1825672.1 hypothetical protein [Haloferula rosea]